MKINLVLIILMSTFSFVSIGQQQSDIKNPEKYSINNQKYKSLYLDGFLNIKKEGKPVISDDWMVVTANFQASKAAAKILEKGGTAVDAMISAQIVLGLVEPESSGLGGGAFLVYYDNVKKEVTTLDGRETAPKKVSPVMFQDNKGNPIKFFDAVIGGKSVGVPGVPALLEKSYLKWGKTKWSLLFEDGIKLADDGFVVSKKLSSSVKKNKESLIKFKKNKEYFFPQNIPIEPDQILLNKEYAKTLKQFSQHGSKVFYSGKIAKDIIYTVQKSSHNPGVLSIEDLLFYKVIERKPVCSLYRDFKVCGMGPPSSGALTISQILGMIEKYDLSKLGPKNPETWRIIGDASRLAFADRSLYMADKDFVNVPIDQLINKKYLLKRAKQLETKKKIEVIEAGKLYNKNSLNYAKDISIELPSTSHISIVDIYGNALSMTTTIENGFGSRLMTKSGFLLNNQLTDFSFKTHNEGKKIANSIEPGKRPRSSMSPTIIFKDNKPIYIIGSPGGSQIIGYVVNTIIALIDWKMNVQAASSMPHAINRFGTYDLELGTSIAELKIPLEQMGYKVNLKKFFSGLNIIEINNKLYGGSDHRREGIAIGN
ncbi:MAG: gamma-glutamyltransferase [Proteobacteria bacterium]|jgi:gamma-glutamyltranspeptidase / glutathione hydrolase|nr:gamma-glutamyltransferase [Pseudomonadota bacterium]MDA1134700.1 gamma-glutamyltransferase [Pseudomonadota bacterium]